MGWNTGVLLTFFFFQPISDTSSYSTPVGWVEQNSAAVGAGTECTICYENSIDAVLYMCGHMCMCYECALQQWRGKGGGQCPLCRAVIRDVIRTYKSWILPSGISRTVTRIKCAKLWSKIATYG